MLANVADSLLRQIGVTLRIVLLLSEKAVQSLSRSQSYTPSAICDFRKTGQFDKKARKKVGL